ncbi:MAG TPA: hypothetical protein V6D17_21935, partial [Candidatus Obscuribacterales bacterium]
ALNQVGAFLRNKLADREVAEQYFHDMAQANNAKMLGKNSINLEDYGVSFVKRGGSTNVEVDPKIVEAANAKDVMPVNTSGPSSPNGNKYMCGYQPFSVSLPATGDTLTFVGVTVCPQDRPHLIQYGAFLQEANDDFAVGKGVPGYPESTLPPNSFMSKGNSLESKSSKFTNAVAAAIVGSLDRQFSMNMEYGYLEIKNGPSHQGPKGGHALQGKDVFCHALSGEGIYITGTENKDYFCTRNEVSTTKSLDVNPNMTLNELRNELTAANEDFEVSHDDLEHDLNSVNGHNGDWYHKLMRRSMELTSIDNYIDQWYRYNKIENRLVKMLLWRNNIPDKEESLKVIRHRDGSKLTRKELLKIDEHTKDLIFWHDYKQDKGPNSKELLMLEAFKKGYDQYGTQDSGHIQGNGFTSLEQFKSDVLTSRYGCTNCATVMAPQSKSGVKYFDHKKAYPSPQNPWNFGEVKTPYDYLMMIDQSLGAEPCASTTLIAKLVKRCQQIKPGVTQQDVLDLLKTRQLPLGSSLYLFLEGGTFKLSPTPPPWRIPGTTADGTGSSSGLSCNATYDVIGKLVNCSSEPPNGPIKKLPSNPPVDPNTDGHYPGWAWRHSPAASCSDSANWIPSSGYNHLLGVIEFNNSCTGGGQFCEPN